MSGACSSLFTLASELQESLQLRVGMFGYFHSDGQVNVVNGRLPFLSHSLFKGNNDKDIREIEKAKNIQRKIIRKINRDL